jgi:hypothetical protein
MRLFIGVFVVAAAVACARSAEAQPTTRWDAGASFGLIGGRGLDGDRTYGDAFPAAFNADLGHYWTPHLKLDVGATLTPRRERYDYSSYPASNPFGPYVLTSVDRTFNALSGAFTYQFFENAMMHPYVSGGALIGWQREHRHRDDTIVTSNRIGVNVPGIDVQSTETIVRPFLAAGAKSYFNERAFVRSELLLAADGRGLSYALLRLGFGVDF